MSERALIDQGLHLFPQIQLDPLLCAPLAILVLLKVLVKMKTVISSDRTITTAPGDLGEAN